MSSNSFKVSTQQFIRRTNPLFANLQTQIHTAFIDSTEPRLAESNLYTCKRLASYTEEDTAAMIARCPQDIKNAASSKDKLSTLGSTEIDLIDFLFNYRYNRVLAIMGSVGVGKTTFLKYVLEDARRECCSLRRFFPVILNILAIGDTSPSYLDLAYEAIRAIKNSLSIGNLSDQSKESDVKNILAQFDVFSGLGADADRVEMLTNAYSTSHFVEIFRRLRDICAPDVEPIIVFDNVDQLTQEAVTRVCSLATSLHLTSKLPVLVAMRPATFLTQNERVHGAGVVYHFRIDVQPPDLRAVIEPRIRFALSSYGSLVIDTPGSSRLEIKNVVKSLRSLTRNVLNSSNQKFLLQDLCNNNVRKALASFAFFLSYHELRLDLLANVASHDQDRQKTGDLSDAWRGHLIDGLMVGNREFFSDIEGSCPIINIFSYEQFGLNDCLILFRIISILDWLGKSVDITEIVKNVESFGYNESYIRPALEILLKKGLISSPESETKVSKAKMLMISAAGKLYLNYLLENKQYIINVVFDVPLRHEKWFTEKRKTFEVSLSSIDELLEKIYLQEKAQLELVLKDVDNVAQLGSIVHVGLLTRKVLIGAKKLVDDAFFAKHERAKEAAEQFAFKIRDMELRIEDGERLLQAELMSKRASPPQTSSTRFQVDLGDSNEIFMTVPKYVGPATKNVVNISLKLNNSVSVRNVLALCWQSLEDAGTIELAHLYRAPTEGYFSGQFVLSDVGEVKPFPRSKVTIFSGTDPFIVRRFASPV